MKEINETEILRRLEVLSQIEPGPVAFGCAMERIRKMAAETQEREGTLGTKVWQLIVPGGLTRIAAAAVIIFGLIIGLNYFGGSIDPATTSFAAILDQIYKARTVSYKETVSENAGIVSTSEVVAAESRYRVKSVHPDGSDSVAVADFILGKSLELRPSANKAVITQLIGKQRTEEPFNYTDWISKLHEKDCKFAGQEEIEGKLANVYVAEDIIGETKIWVDPGTNLPICIQEVEMKRPGAILPAISLNIADFGGSDDEGDITLSCSSTLSRVETCTTVKSDFVWDVELDESLFSMVPPEGYTVEEKMQDMRNMGENELIYALGFLAEMSGGKFPSAINELCDPNIVKPMLIKKFDRSGDSGEEMQQALQALEKILYGFTFAQDQKVEGSWDYVGTEVQLGDSTKPLCWWKPRNSEMYRVIYGDLSIDDLADEDLAEIADVWGSE